MKPVIAPLLSLAALAAAPAVASAGTVTFDQPCYLVGEQGVVTLAGYAPGTTVHLESNLLDPIDVIADDAGTVQQGFQAGAPFTRPGAAPFTVTATQVDDPAQTGAGASQVTEYRFQTSAGRKPPKAKRTWRFSGFTEGAAIYGHFRLRSKLKRTYRFGTASGPCGLLTTRAPAIPIRGRARAGRYRIQVDQKKRYSAATRPRLTTTNVVFTARAVLRPATQTLLGSPAVWGV